MLLRPSMKPGAEHIRHRCSQSQHLVNAAGTQPATIHGFVDDLHTVRKRQLTSQVAAGDLAVGLPTATVSASDAADHALAAPARLPQRRTPRAVAPPSGRPSAAALLYSGRTAVAFTTSPGLGPR
jgi:hypothetical protein